MKKRALILTAVLTAAALTGGSGYLPVTDGIRSKMIQNVYADAEDSKESADTETSDSVLDQATIMYQQYNYDEAIKLLKKQDDFTKNKDYMDLAAKCQIAKKSLVEYPLEKITHVFFHTLIEDTSRAFDGDSKSGNYNQVMTTVSEFNKIIQIMYDKGYVLVSPHDMATVNKDGTMSRGKIMVPEGKIPFVLSQDDVSYYHYMDGDGCASKLVLDENGEVKNEYVDADGNVLVGDYDLVPLLDSFIKEHPDKSIGIITPFTNQKELINKALKDNGMENIPCGTVHAFQGDEKDVVLFSLAITQQTYQGTYDWLKNNKELINVATSRAKDQLVILSDIKELKRLHSAGDDDIYELVDYVQTNGEAQVTARETSSRALGIKPYSTQTEAAFLTTLNHALDNVLNTNNRCVVQREVSIAHVFQENESYDDLFYTGRFDFVVYEKGYRGQDMPILAIEVDGKEHKENAIVRARDEKKNAICRAHGFELIRVENSYARRYNYIKNILIQYFKSVR